MLGPRGENPRASTAEVRGARTIMRASTQESAFARVREQLPLPCQTSSFTIQTEGDEARRCVRHVTHIRGLTGITLRLRARWPVAF